MPEIDAYTAPGITVGISDRQGQLRYQSADVGAATHLPIAVAQQHVLATGQSSVTEITVEGQRTLIALDPVFANSQEVIGVSYVARSMQDVVTTLGNLRWLLIAASVVGLAAALSGGYLLTRRALAPLALIARTATTITQGLEVKDGTPHTSLQQRVPPVQETGELGALVADVNRMLDALAAYDTRQRQFIADASHELRTPLTTIRGNLEFIRRAPTAAAGEREQALHDASAEAERMAELVNNLLSLAHAENQNDAEAQSMVEVDAVVVDAFHIARERARTLGIPVEQITLTALTPVAAWGVATQLRQVMLILIDNALKYAPGPLALGLERRDDQAIITVRDHGPGIAAVDLPHIFERFYRADRARNREGSGLGLAIAHTLIQQHGGTLTATSRLGQGATFTITLPALPAKG